MAEAFKALGTHLMNYYTPVQGQLLEAFSANPKNFECLKKVALLVGIVGKEDEAVR